MSEFVGAIALVRHPRELEKRWLAWWNSNANHFDFVTAEKLQGDSFAECVEREIAWVIDLRRNKDYLVSRMARLHMQESIVVNGIETATTVEFFVADLFGRESRNSVESNANVRWLTNAELLKGHTDDNKEVNPWLVQLLRKADILR